MNELYDAVFAALNKYPGWDDSAVGYALKNNESERRKIARAVTAAAAPILERSDTAARLLAVDVRQDTLDAERDKVQALQDVLADMIRALDIMGEEHNDAAYDGLLQRARDINEGNYSA